MASTPAEELWTSRQLKPDFADLVTHQGHAYGNDGGLLACIDLQTGERKWKGGRYGKGQILLLENSGLLLILSEQGQVVLVAADPSEHRETRFLSGARRQDLESSSARRRPFIHT